MSDLKSYRVTVSGFINGTWHKKGAILKLQHQAAKYQGGKLKPARMSRRRKAAK